jgi:alpha-1,3-rhamnosyltransferase
MTPIDRHKMPLVTAVIPVYNHEKYVRESIRSILDQSYSEIELFVINDGSRDRSHDVVQTLIEECRSRFVRFEYINRENRGVSATLNQALEMSSGKYFSALASDDVADCDKFTFLVKALESAGDNTAAAFGDASFIDEHGRSIVMNERCQIHDSKSGKAYSTFLELNTRYRNFDYKSAEFGTYRELLLGNYLPAMSCVLKTACIREAGGWTEGNVLEDWEMWIKLARRHDLIFVDAAVAHYRIHGRNSHDTMKRKQLESAMLLIAREREHCFRSGLRRVWKDAFNQQLHLFLMHGGSPLTDALRELKPANIPSFVSFLWRSRRDTNRRKRLSRA